jgi:hypothetical protein
MSKRDHHDCARLTYPNPPAPEPTRLFVLPIISNRWNFESRAHNHPSGDPKPSRDDIEMTREAKAAAEALGNAIHDHLVIGRKGHATFRSLGLL